MGTEKPGQNNLEEILAGLARERALHKDTEAIAGKLLDEKPASYEEETERKFIEYHPDAVMIRDKLTAAIAKIQNPDLGPCLEINLPRELPKGILVSIDRRRTIETSLDLDAFMDEFARSNALEIDKPSSPRPFADRRHYRIRFPEKT
jgi:hypothetical protein